MLPKKSVRNFVLKSYLLGLKNTEPFFFQQNEDFYPEYDAKTIALLDSKDIVVIVAYEDGEFETYGGPFNLQSEKPVSGWIMLKKPDTIVGFYVKKPFRRRKIGTQLVTRGYAIIGNPKEVFLMTPMKSLFLFLRSVLYQKAKITYRGP